MFRSLAFIVLMGIAGCASAGEEMVYRSPELTVRLTLEPCDIPEIAIGLVAAESQTPPRKAYVTHRGMEVLGCWGLSSDGKALIGDEAGQAGFIPATEFHRPASI